MEAVPIECVVDRDRAAEPRSPVKAEMGPARQVQMEDVEERLVPAHGDAVLGDAAESGRHPLVERRTERVVDPLDGTGDQVLRDRLDLEPVDADDAEPLVQEMVRERVAGGAHADHQHVHAGVGPRVLPLEPQRVPPGEQAPDLESPADAQDVAQDARLDLRNVHRILLLVHAGLHAVVADAVPRPWRHRIVDADQRQRGEEIALPGRGVHFGDALLERAPGQRRSQRVLAVAG